MEGNRVSVLNPEGNNLEENYIFQGRTSFRLVLQICLKEHTLNSNTLPSLSSVHSKYKPELFFSLVEPNKINGEFVEVC